MMDKERMDVLLKEYDVCQSDNKSIGSEVWSATTIFLSINVLLLGGIAAGIINGNWTQGARWPVIVLGVGIILIFINWIRWLNRRQFLTNINYERMREIEDLLKMEKTWLAYGLDLKYNPKRLDDFCKLPDELKKKLNKLSEYYPNKFWKRFPKYALPRGFEGLRCIAWVVISLWTIFIVMAFVSN